MWYTRLGSQVSCYRLLPSLCCMYKLRSGDILYVSDTEFFYNIIIMRVGSCKDECLRLFCVWFYPCMGMGDTIVFMICLNFDCMLLHHYFELMFSFDILLAAVSCLEMRIAESGFLIIKLTWNVVAFGGQFSCKFCNDTRCWWFNLIYQHILSWLCTFVWIILIAPFVTT